MAQFNVNSRMETLRHREIAAFTKAMMLQAEAEANPQDDRLAKRLEMAWKVALAAEEHREIAQETVENEAGAAFLLTHAD